MARNPFRRKDRAQDLTQFRGLGPVATRIVDQWRNDMAILERWGTRLERELDGADETELLIVERELEALRLLRDAVFARYQHRWQRATGEPFPMTEGLANVARPLVLRTDLLTLVETPAANGTKR